MYTWYITQVRDHFAVATASASFFFDDGACFGVCVHVFIYARTWPRRSRYRLDLRFSSPTAPASSLAPRKVSSFVSRFSVPPYPLGIPYARICIWFCEAVPAALCSAHVYGTAAWWHVHVAVYIYIYIFAVYIVIYRNIYIFCTDFLYIYKIK